MLSRLVSSFEASQVAYEARLAAGVQPLPSPFWTRLPFLDYTNTAALLWVNAAYLLLVAALFVFIRRRGVGFELRNAMIVRARTALLRAARRPAAAARSIGLVLIRFAGFSEKQVYNATCVALAGYVVYGIVAYKYEEPGTFACNPPDFSAAGRALSHASWCAPRSLAARCWALTRRCRSAGCTTPRSSSNTGTRCSSCCAAASGSSPSCTCTTT